MSHARTPPRFVPEPLAQKPFCTQEKCESHRCETAATEQTKWEASANLRECGHTRSKATKNRRRRQMPRRSATADNCVAVTKSRKTANSGKSWRRSVYMKGLPKPMGGQTNTQARHTYLTASQNSRLQAAVMAKKESTAGSTLIRQIKKGHTHRRSLPSGATGMQQEA